MALHVLTDGHMRLGGGVIKLKELFQLRDRQGMECRQGHKGDILRAECIARLEVQHARQNADRQGGLREY